MNEYSDKKTAKFHHHLNQRFVVSYETGITGFSLLSSVALSG